MEDLKVLKLLQESYPTVQSAATELINLSAILHLPKGTESFIADIHGEYEAFNHLLKNASGIILEKIKQRFSFQSEAYQKRLAFFIYYPTAMMRKYQTKLNHEAHQELIRQTIHDMVTLARIVVIKYTQSKVRKALPEEFAYVMNELIYESRSHDDKKPYYEAILDAVFKTKREGKLLLEMSRVIRRLAIDRLHIVGDIFDRGRSPHKVMEKLTTMKSVDIQWGNHDVNWIGAASGSLVAICNVIRIAARYGNLDSLEDGYGINLRPLASLAASLYKHDPATLFKPISDDVSELEDEKLVARMHKAITIIQFKCEAAVIKRHPEYGLDNRLLLEKVNLKDGTVKLDKTYKLEDTHFPTVDLNDPTALHPQEAMVMEHLRNSFLHNEMLQKHVKYLLQKGSLYLRYNGNLLFHAVVPMHEDGSFMKTTLEGHEVSGRALFERLDQAIRAAYLARHEKEDALKDIFMYAWQGPTSPLFGKHTMKTFERYFIKDASLHEEQLNPYYQLRSQVEIIDTIFEEFGLHPKTAKLVNGHVPKDITQGEDVILAKGKVYLIDGGMSKQYKNKTEIGGYTLISDSYAYYLVSHSRFESVSELIESETDMISLTHEEDLLDRRSYIYDTDNGQTLKEKINDLNHLIEAYRTGTLKEASLKEK